MQALDRGLARSAWGVPQTGSGGEPLKMPAFRTQFTDSEIARVAGFVRGAWGNNAPPIAPAEVTRLRDAIHR